MAGRPSKKIFMQILWTGVESSVPSLYLFTDSKRYMFNCSEGMQRLFTQCKFKIGKLDTFFLTRFQWSHIGGLPGFGMTLRDAKKYQVIKDTACTVNQNNKSQKKKESQKNGEKVPNENQSTSSQVINCINGTINVHGPQGLRRVMNATRNFMRFDASGIQFNVIEHGTFRKHNDMIPYKDEEITIHPIPIYDTNSGMSHDQFYSSDGLLETIDVSPRFTPPFICYECHVKPIPGRFLKEKADKLGIPKDLTRKRLVDGETVTLKDGRQIIPEQVVEPKQPGPIFLILDCPSKVNVKNLTENLSMRNLTQSVKSNVDIVFHLTSKLVADEAEYKDLVSSFPKSTKHVFLNSPEEKRVVFHSQANLQAQLNELCPVFFPKIADSEKMLDITATDINNEKIYNFTKINLRESVGSTTGYIDNTDVYSNSITPDVKYSPHTIEGKVAMTANDEKASNLCVIICENDEKPSQCGKRKSDDTNDIVINKACKVSQEFPKVVLLGTGAAIPSKCRNVSATLVFLGENDAVLFDSGEDTFGQLCRHYKDVDSVIRKIKIVFISHMHADHHLGLVTLLKRYELNKQKGDPDNILVVGPRLFCNWLTNYAEASETLKFEYVRCEDVYTQTLLRENINVQSVPVNHPGMAHGFVVSFNSNMKITYSGDTTPCDELINAGMHSTLLIHEATLEDDMLEEAIARKHSTTSQALEVAQKMKAQNVLLTHFSQRYPRMPVLNSNLEKHTAFAFDHMELTLGDINHFQTVIPKLSDLFPQHEKEDMVAEES